MYTGGRRGGGGVVSSKKLSHKNAIKDKKRQQSGPPPRFSDNPKYPPKTIWPEPQGPPLDFQLLCIYGSGGTEEVGMGVCKKLFKNCQKIADILMGSLLGERQTDSINRMITISE